MSTTLISSCKMDLTNVVTTTRAIKVQPDILSVQSALCLKLPSDQNEYLYVFVGVVNYQLR